MTEDEPNLVGRVIWLQYFDQNYTFEDAFTAQYCKIKGQYTDTAGAKDWFLVDLSIPFQYKDVTYDHLMIRSRWEGYRIGSSEPTAVFIVLESNPRELENPIQLDMSLYIAWGIAALSEKDANQYH